MSANWRIYLEVASLRFSDWMWLMFYRFLMNEWILVKHLYSSQCTGLEIRCELIHPLALSLKQLWSGCLTNLTCRSGTGVLGWMGQLLLLPQNLSTTTILVAWENDNNFARVEFTGILYTLYILYIVYIRHTWILAKSLTFSGLQWKATNHSKGLSVQNWFPMFCQFDETNCG